MLLRLYCSTNGIKGKLGCLLTLWSDGPFLYEGLKSLSIFTLKHHAELLPASAVVISLLGINIEGFQEVNSPGIEQFLVLRLMRGVEIACGSFPAVMRVRGHDATEGNAREARGN